MEMPVESRGMLNAEVGVGIAELGVATVFRLRFSGVLANRPSILHFSTTSRRRTIPPKVPRATTKRNGR